MAQTRNYLVRVAKTKPTTVFQSWADPTIGQRWKYARKMSRYGSASDAATPVLYRSYHAATVIRPKSYGPAIKLIGTNAGLYWPRREVPSGFFVWP